MKYAVFMEGENYLISTNEDTDIVGFFVTKVVDADSEMNAEERAMELVRKDPVILEAITKSTRNKPTLKVKVVHELLKESQMKHTKYTYFPMENSDV